ncbi:hypothetical protein GGR56DRAFT_27754 [Xylariaceae sp. FL0804]|nr:hypothetical protein GGR56DRAFT_27754 [Xylariaceae sp. FL0804]
MALDEAQKARLMAHMNKDHAAELSQYLRAFNGLSARAAARAQLVDLTLDSLTIRCGSGTTHTVAVSPPMASAADARARLVDMAQRAQRALGIGDVQVRAWTPPQRRGGGAVSFAGVAFYFVCAAAVFGFGLGTGSGGGFGGDGDGNGGWLDAVWRPLGGAQGFRWLVKAMFVPVLAIHVAEAVLFARTRLARHGAVMDDGVWWLWVASTFFEGYPSFKRFDAMVEAERRKKEAAKH